MSEPVGSADEHDVAWVDSLDSDENSSPESSLLSEDAEIIEVGEDYVSPLLADDDENTPILGELVEFSQENEGDAVAAFNAPLSKEQAEELTEHIRSTADVLYVLIARAHAGKAWLPLGYSSFEKYVKSEFDISRSRAYQFLNQAHVIEAITAAVPEGTRVKVNEAAARDLKNLIDELAPELREKTEGLSADEAGDVVVDLVQDYRERSKQNLDDDYDVPLDVDDVDIDLPEFDGEYKGSGGGEFDDLDGLDNFDELLPTGGTTTEFDEDPELFRKKLEHVYGFYTALNALEKLPDPQTIIAAIPDARRATIEEALPKALAWLTSFSEAWQESAKDNDESEEELTSSDDEESNPLEEEQHTSYN